MAKKTKTVAAGEANLNDLAKQICEYEKGHSQVNIAQVKEVLKSLGVILGGMPTEQAMRIVAKLIKKGNA